MRPSPFASVRSVVIHNLDVRGVSLDPSEADTPLIVDPNAHLPFPISLQRFEPVSRRITQVLDLRCRIKLAQLSKRPILNVARKFASSLTLPNSLRLLASERSDHSLSLYMARYAVRIKSEAGHYLPCDDFSELLAQLGSTARA